MSFSVVSSKQQRILLHRIDWSNNRLWLYSFLLILYFQVLYRHPIAADHLADARPFQGLVSLIHGYSDFLCYPRQAVTGYFNLFKWCVFVA